MFQNQLKTQIIEHGNTRPQASIIWLHGLGASSDDFVPIIPELQLPIDLSIRFIFPDAPVRPITINGGFVMPGWYDILSLDGSAAEDLPGFFNSQEAIQALIDQEIQQGIPANRILLAGFSQGGAVTLFTGLQQTQALAGLIVLSAYLPCAEYLLKHRTPISAQIPIFIAHGTHDDIVRFDWGTGTRDQLSALDYQVQWHQYPMSHQVCRQEIDAISQFIQARLKS